VKRFLLVGSVLVSILGVGSFSLLAVAQAAPVGNESLGVVLQFIGHECFLLTTQSGARSLMDPYNDHPAGLKSMPTDLAPDAVTVSHDHPDHNNVACAPGAQILRVAGTYQVKGVNVTGYAGREGSPYGPSAIPHVIFVFEVAGVKIVHLGDSGPVTDPATLAAIADADVVIVNIDGYVIPPSQLLPFLTEIGARTTIIGHYTVKASSPFGGAPTVDQFFARLPKDVVGVRSDESSLVVVPGMATQILALTPTTLIK
jgi:L-ascorbate metabolism protein UlaG (beta-lactamase superfamily)